MKHRTAKWTSAALLATAVFTAGCNGEQAEPAKPSDNSQVQNYTPPPNGSIDLQYNDPMDYDAQVQVMNLDAFDTSAETVAQLLARGVYPICYINVGAWEDWRPDADTFPAEVIGKDYEGWEGEKWLDIRRLDLLEPIIRERLRMCRDKGFLGVDPDNLDGYQTDTGFPLTEEDQLRFLHWLSRLAHEEGLAIGLKNMPELAGQVVGDFDWALTEDCQAQSPSWCERMEPFRKQGKPVFMVEYTDAGVKREDLCARAKELGYVGLLKKRELDGGFRETCRQ